MTQEYWKPVVGWEDFYEVSDQGRVRCLPRKWVPQARTLKVVHSLGKYPQVGLCKPGLHLTRMVHQLVAESFIGPCPERMEVCHCDGDRSNNKLPNLRYDTRRNNHADKAAHGTMARGETCGQSKLKEADVLAIRASDLSASELARQFNVTYANIYAILKRKSWKHI